jgi:hypothetical protein
MFHPVVIMFSLELVAEEIILLDMGTLGGGLFETEVDAGLFDCCAIA